MPDTDTKVVTGAWRQVSDGTEKVQIQVTTGFLWARVSENEPPAGGTGYFVRNMLYFEIGEVGWIRSVSQKENAVIAIT